MGAPLFESYGCKERTGGAPVRVMTRHLAEWGAPCAERDALGAWLGGAEGVALGRNGANHGVDVVSGGCSSISSSLSERLWLMKNASAQSRARPAFAPKVVNSP